MAALAAQAFLEAGGPVHARLVPGGHYLVGIGLGAGGGGGGGGGGGDRAITANKRSNM